MWDILIPLRGQDKRSRTRQILVLDRDRPLGIIAPSHTNNVYIKFLQYFNVKREVVFDSARIPINKYYSFLEILHVACKIGLID